MQIQISWLLQKPTDLDLHCLLKQGMSCPAREGFINFLPFDWRCIFCDILFAPPRTKPLLKRVPSKRKEFAPDGRLWLDWTDTQPDLSHRSAHIHFVGFVMSWLIFITITAFLSTAVIIVVVVIVVVLICVLGGWFYYAYTHPTTPSGRWLIEVYDLYELFNGQAITV